MFGFAGHVAVAVAIAVAVAVAIAVAITIAVTITANLACRVAMGTLATSCHSYENRGQARDTDVMAHCLAEF